MYERRGNRCWDQLRFPGCAFLLIVLVGLATASIASELSAEEQIERAAKLLRTGNPDDRAKAIEELRPAVAQGDPKAERILGWIHLDQFERTGDSNDISIARELLEKSANAGDAGAQCLWGIILEEGAGGAPDPAAAMAWFRKSALAGHRRGQFRLGMAYYNGLIVERDPVEAACWLDAAAQEGSSEAQSMLGALYCDGDGVSRNYETGIAWLVAAITQGDTNALIALGHLFQYGQGVPRDGLEAQRLYHEAAAAGAAEAHDKLARLFMADKEYEVAITHIEAAVQMGSLYGEYLMGRSYDDDVFGRVDRKTALAWYERAAEQGNAAAMHAIGNLYYRGDGAPHVTQDFTLAAAWYRRAAEEGYAPGQRDFAAVLMDGTGVEKDEAEGFRWLRRAAEQEDAHAQFNLALHLGTLQDASARGESMTWFIRAAEQGLVDAQVNVGWCFLKGEGVEKDVEAALTWLRRAVDQGDAEAQYMLAAQLLSGKEVEQDVGEGMELLESAVAQEHADAQFLLAYHLQQGELIPKDFDRARKLYQRAADRGNANAMFSLGWTYETGTGVDADLEEAVAWYTEAVAHGSERAEKALERIRKSKLSTTERFVEWLIGAE